jgi:hypothetical protein
MRGSRLVVALVLAFPTAAAAQHEGGSSTVHNLSATGPGEIWALEETEVCKFCHIPHNAVVPQPLWGHTLSTVDRYLVPTIRRGKGASEPAPQPDGSSRLCLSCHDGTVALGDIGGSGPPIAMAGAQRLDRGRRGHIGTDLSGSHPISFVVPDGEPGGPDSERDMGLRPLDLIRSEESVSLDAKGKMQCTTCHDPHSDRNHDPGRVPRFWVKPTVD